MRFTLHSLVILCTSFLLFSACADECTFRDWEGTYIGTIYCDNFTVDGVIVDAFLDYDGATVVYIGDYFSTAFYDDGCDIDFYQRSSVGRDDFEEEYYLELRGDEIYWEYESNEDGYRTSCDGSFVRF